MLIADDLAEHQPVDMARHTNVGDDQIDVAAGFQHLVRIDRIAGGGDLEPGLLERHDELLDDQLLVIDNKHLTLAPGHKHTPRCGDETMSSIDKDGDQAIECRAKAADPNAAAANG
jgi:hypothetical protein